jgi:hypothetical protein
LSNPFIVVNNQDFSLRRTFGCVHGCRPYCNLMTRFRSSFAFLHSAEVDAFMLNFRV